MHVCVSVRDGSGLVGTDNSDARPLYFTTTVEPQTLRRLHEKQWAIARAGTFQNS